MQVSSFITKVHNAVDYQHLFVLQMVNLYRDPRGEKIFQRSNPSNNINASKTAEAVLSNGGDGQLVAVLEGRIQEQKLLIEQKDKQIRELEKAVSEIF